MKNNESEMLNYYHRGCMYFNKSNLSDKAQAEIWFRQVINFDLRNLNEEQLILYNDALNKLEKIKQLFKDDYNIHKKIKPSKAQVSSSIKKTNKKSIISKTDNKLDSLEIKLNTLTGWKENPKITKKSITPYEFNKDRNYLLDIKFPPNFNDSKWLSNYIYSSEDNSNDFTKYKLIPYKIVFEVFHQKTSDQIVSVIKDSYPKYLHSDIPAFASYKKFADSYLKNYKSFINIEERFNIFTEISFFLPNKQIVWVQHSGLPCSIDAYKEGLSVRHDYQYSEGLSQIVDNMLWSDNKLEVIPRTRWNAILENREFISDHDQKQKLEAQKTLDEISNNQNKKEPKKFEMNDEEKAMYIQLEKSKYFKEVLKQYEYLFDKYDSESTFKTGFAFHVFNMMWLKVDFKIDLKSKVNNILFPGTGVNHLPSDYKSYKKNIKIIPTLPNFDSTFFKIIG